MQINRRLFIRLDVAGPVALCSCGKSDYDSRVMKEYAEQVKKTSSLQYPLDEYFPEIPVTISDPPRGSHIIPGKMVLHRRGHLCMH